MDTLPAALPTVEEIKAGDHFNIRGRLWGSREVAKVGPHFIVKYGEAVDLIEAENMLFVMRNCNIPIPKLYAAYTGEDDVKYIAMQYIPSPALTGCWDDLLLYPIGEKESSIAGPFDTQADLNQGYANQLLEVNRPRRNAEFYSRALPRFLKGHKPVFTHADLQLKNLVLDGNGKVFIIDWEDAGFYPTYWEYYVALTGASYDWSSDWSEYIPLILDEYLVKFAWLDRIRMELWL